jgi:hypothetical protein
MLPLESVDNASAEQMLSELQVQNDILNAVILDSKGNVLHPILNLDQMQPISSLYPP